MTDREHERPPTAVGGSLTQKPDPQTPTDGPSTSGSGSGDSRWAFALALVILLSCAAASDLDEFRIKREPVFEFARKPVVTRNGDRVTITFETKGLCDVTIAIEEAPPGTVPFSGSSGMASESADARKRGLSPSDGSGGGESGRGRRENVAGNGDRHLAAARSQSPFPAPSQSPFPRIVRHLASGVLGPNAPAPFQKDSKTQTIVWDGKDDRGRYIDDKDSLTVRVSLGLRARFERTLFWSPYKRLRQGSARWGFVGTQAGLPTPRIAAAPEGVYVFEGRGVDHLRFFDHHGRYVRTVYPPPQTRLASINGLTWHAFPQEGAPLDARPFDASDTMPVAARGRPVGWFNGPREVLPLKHHILQTTFLTSGPSGLVEKVPSMFGTAATALAVQGDRIALVHRSLNRLGTDGGGPSTGSGQARLPLKGPETHFDVFLRLDGIPDLHWITSPTSAAFSPDGRTLYCTGYMYRQGRHTIRIEKDCLHGVIALDYGSNRPARVFAGSMKQNDCGTANGRFRDATSVDCDARGRVYVADYCNDRIQVFRPDGAHIKNIPAYKPAVIRIHRRTQEVYVFSWTLDHWNTLGRDAEVAGKKITIPPRLTVLGPFDNPKRRATYVLPLLQYSPYYRRGKVWAGLEYTAEIDSWTEPATLWLVPGHPGAQDFTGRERVSWQEAAIKLYALRDGKLDLLRDFGPIAKKQVFRLQPPMFGRQRLYVNPKTGLLYVVEGENSNYKGFNDILEIDPATGRIRKIPLPFDAEDMAIDGQGSFYFRTHTLLARYDLTDTGRMASPPDNARDRGRGDDALAARCWKEVPFDYGQAQRNVGTSSSRDGRRTDVVAGIPLFNGTGWHKGGIAINSAGDILVSTLATKGDAVPDLPLVTDEAHVGSAFKGGYVPVIYPGRLRMGEVHVFDERGRLKFKDAAKGIVDLFGVGLDKDDNLYVLNAPARILDGKRYFNPLSSTLTKFRPGAGRVMSENSHLIPVAVTRRPDRPHDIYKGTSPAWVDGAEWMYGGVGYSGHSAVAASGHCSCWNCRFVLDYFARSFVPELRRFHIAVLDTNGNLITRIGQYGNVDDGVPLGTVPFSGSGRKRGLSPSGGSKVGESGRGREGRVGGNGDRHLAAARSQSPFPARSQSPFPAVPRSIGGDEIALMHGAYVATQTDRRLFIADPGNARIVSARLGYETNERIALKGIQDQGASP